MSPRRGLTRAEIVESASKLADQEGLQQLSIHAVASDLDIKPPSLYNHVRGLEELYELLALHGCTTFYERLQQATAQYQKDEALRHLCFTYIDFAKSHPGLYEALSRSARKDDLPLLKAQEQIVEVVLDVLYQYGLEETQSIHLVRMLRSMLHGFVMLETTQGFGLPYDLEETIEIMIQTFLQGVKGM